MAKRRAATPVALTAAQRDRLESLWFVYGNRGPKETYGNHQFIQGLLERGEDARPLFTARAPARERPTPECEAAVEAVLKGEGTGGSLRLVKSIEVRPRPETDPELKAILDDMNRRYRVQRERLDRGPDDKDAA